MRIGMLLALSMALASGCVDAPDSTMITASATQDATGTSTLIIPITPPIVDGARAGIWQLISGAGSSGQKLYVPLALPVGTSIVGVRVRVKDDAMTLGARVQAQLVRMSDNSEVFAVQNTSSQSTGAGHEETITMTGTVSTVAASNYFVQIYNAAGSSNSLSKAYRLELDVVAAP
jgi:hypothetical protein